MPAALRFSPAHAAVTEQVLHGLACCLPVVILEPGPPVRGSEEGLYRAGQVNEEVAHQEKPAAAKKDKPKLFSTHVYRFWPIL